MTTSTDTGIAQRTERWADFLENPQTERHLFLIRCPWDGKDDPRPPVWPAMKQQRIDWICRDYERQLARATWLDDDWVPHLNFLTGTEIFAEAFGCEVERQEDNMPFALPFVHEADQADALHAPSLHESTLGLQFEIADAVRARCGNDAITRLPDIQSPMDIVALIWDKAELFIAMLETPVAVKRLAREVRSLLIGFLDEWFARYGKAFVAHWPEYFMPYGITLSEDEIGAVSSDIFDEFFLPELVELSRHFGAMGMHCCAHARHQWDGFKQIPDLKLLNLVQPRDVTQQAYAEFATHTAQMHAWCGDGDNPTAWPAQLPSSARVVFQVTAEDEDHAKRLADSMRTTCMRKP